MNEITWEELADIYGRETGKKARIQPMDRIFEGPEERTDLFILNKNGTLSLREGGQG